MIITLGKKLNFESNREINNIEIKQLGYIKDRDKISEVYNIADIFCISSLDDNFPTTVLEALACGVPVAGFRVGGISEVINSEDYGFIVNPGNISQLYTASNKALEKNWDENKIAQYGSNFTWEKVVYELIRIYRNILRGSDRDAK